MDGQRLVSGSVDMGAHRESNQQLRSLTLLEGVMVTSSLRNDPTLTLINCCFVPNFALASLTLTFSGLQRNPVWHPRQKFDQQECHI